MKSIVLPQLRQTFNYDCGAKALQAILAYYGIEIREDHIIKETKTTKKLGTPLQGILDVAHKYGLKTDDREMSIEDIKNFIKKDIPVILMLQAWTNTRKMNWKKDWIDGHFAVAIGYTKDTILFGDPSSFERTFLKYTELENRWHDIDTDGEKYFHYGVAIFGKSPKFKPTKVVHMD